MRELPGEKKMFKRAVERKVEDGEEDSMEKQGKSREGQID